MSSPNKSIPIKLKLPLLILFKSSQTFLEVTPSKTPISKKFLGLNLETKSLIDKSHF